MEEGASNSLRADSEIPILQRWARSLNGLPTFTYEMLAKHLSMENSGAGSQKHKKLGCQMFKDKYVGKVEVKANVGKDMLHVMLLG